MNLEAVRKLKATVKAYGNSEHHVLKIFYFGTKGLYKLLNAIYRFITRFIMSSNYRSIIYLRLFKPKEIHQTTTLTSFNRYPKIFSSCKEYFNDRNNLKLLSYLGCSTGEEVVSLRLYFPDSDIIGTDINKNCLKQSRKRNLDDKQKFIHSTNYNISKHGPYDAILCMAVLQRTPHSVHNQGIKNIKKIYPFYKFDNQLIELDKNVKINGLIVVHFSQYLFEDSSIATRYKAYGDSRQNQKTPFFDKSSDIIENVKQPLSIYKKIRM